MALFTLFRGALPGLAVLAGLLTAPAAHAQTAPTWASVQRATSATSPSLSQATGIVVAADGSYYLTGAFDGTIALGSVTLTAGAGGAHLFLARYNAAGAVLWARQIDGSTAFGYLSGELAVDAAGNAYLAGSFSGTAALGATSLTCTFTNAYLVKYNAQGTQQWVRQGTGAFTRAMSVAVDAGGNVLVAGDASAAIDFGGTALTGAGMFCYRFSPAGVALQGRLVGLASANSSGSPTAMALDAAGNTYLAGGISGTMTFGGTAFSSNGASDILLCKLDPAGNYLWATVSGGANDDFITALALGPDGQPVVCGLSEAIVNGPRNSRVYVARFTAQGTPVWSHHLASLTAGPTGAYGMAYDGRGGYLVTGLFSGTVAFGATTLTAAVGPQLFVARYTAQGQAIWADQAVGTTGYSVGLAVAVDAGGTGYLTGYAGGPLALGGLASPPTTGSADAFVAKLTAGGTLTAARPATAGLALAAYPNPASGSVTLRLPVGGGQLALLDALGRTVRRQALPATAGDCPVSLAGLAPGRYQLRATLGNGRPATAPLLVR